MFFKTNLAQTMLFLAIFCPKDLVAEPVIGKEFPPVVIEGNDGGLVKGGPWKSSEQLRGNIQILFYVDPDERDTNEETSLALKNEAFPPEIFRSHAIINLAATWLPNTFIESSLEKKQKEFERTIYVKDLKKKLVKEWGVADDSSVIMLFDKDGSLLFYYAGKLPESERVKLITMIKDKLKIGSSGPKKN